MGLWRVLGFEYIKRRIRNILGREFEEEDKVIFGASILKGAFRFLLFLQLHQVSSVFEEVSMRYGEIGKKCLS